MNKDDTFYVFGKFFGFPECCIKSFYSMEHVGDCRKLAGTGYIPCLKCNEKTEAELIAVISKNRVCKTPFPFEDRKAVEELLKLF